MSSVSGASKDNGNVSWQEALTATKDTAAPSAPPKAPPLPAPTAVAKEILGVEKANPSGPPSSITPARASLPRNQKNPVSNFLEGSLTSIKQFFREKKMPSHLSEQSSSRTSTPLRGQDSLTPPPLSPPTHSETPPPPTLWQPAARHPVVTSTSIKLAGHGTIITSGPPAPKTPSAPAPAKPVTPPNASSAPSMTDALAKELDSSLRAQSIKEERAHLWDGEAGKTTSRPPVVFSSQVAAIVDKMKNKQMAEAQKRAVSAERGGNPGSLYELQKLDGSQNPVAKAGAEVFIEKSKLPEAGKAPVDSLNNDSVTTFINAVITKESEQRGNKPDLHYDKLVSELKNIHDPENPTTPKEDLQKACALIEKKLTKEGLDAASKKNMNNMLTAIKSQLKPYEDSPSQYKLDDVMNNLRLLSTNEKLSPEVRSSAFAALRELQRMQNPANTLEPEQQGSHIDEETLKRIMGQSPGLFEKSIKNTVAYVSSYDALARNQFDPFVKSTLGSIAKATVPDFAHRNDAAMSEKLGEENKREILAGKIFGTMGFSHLLAPKFESATAQEGSATVMKGESDMKGAISGRWVSEQKGPSKEDYATMDNASKALLEAKRSNDNDAIAKAQKNYDEARQVISDKEIVGQAQTHIRADWENMMNTSVRLEQARRKDPEAAKKLEEQLAVMERDYEDKVLNFTELVQNSNAKNLTADDKAAIKATRQAFEESMQEQAFMDLALGSADSHMGQYLVADGRIKCIDFARFLPPSRVVELKNSKGETETMLTSRSSNLDHPAVSRPMSPHMAERIKNMDIDKIANDMKPLVGDELQFQEAEKKLGSLKNDMDDLTTAFKDSSPEGPGKLKKLIVDIAAKRGIPVDENKTLSDQANVVYSAVFKQYNTEGAKQFNQIHPEAFKEFISNLRTAQDYVRSTPNPTVAGIYAATHKDEAALIKFAGRFISNPSLYTCVGRTANGLQKRSLESIINQAEKSPLTDAAEIAQMRAHLANLSEHRKPAHTVGTAYSI